MLAEDWKEYFRMSRESCIALCEELHPFIIKNKTRLRKPVLVETQVAVTLYYLAAEG